MGFRDRISKAIVESAAEETPQFPSAEPTPLLPFALIRDYLESHPLTVHLECSAWNVYKALLDWYQCTMKEEEVPQQPSSRKRPRNSCPHCADGVTFLDERAGENVCTSCGVVADLRSVNVNPEFALTHEETSIGGMPCVKGVSRWLVHKNAAAPTIIARNSNHWERLLHWNQFTNWTTDELRRMDAVLKTWSGGAHSDHTRLAAALIFPSIRDQFPNTSVIRGTVHSASRGEQVRLQPVVDTTPLPQFSCPKCSVRVFRRVDARFHCRR